ncbi:hypothetical protein P9265_07290 [Schinkia azotoformans]|uniref:hypothetical protein n=2 Tax=Schinkia azotoformans TaxID=1454 RepID=UPI002E23E494|nr:hypothetical protein [Schinkia azotoformans]
MMTEREQANIENTDVELQKQIQRLQKTIQIYEQLAEAVRTAAVIDRSIYTGERDNDWLSIDRDDYVKIMAIISQLDIWKPWNHTIQPRITK